MERGSQGAKAAAAADAAPSALGPGAMTADLSPLATAPAVPPLPPPPPAESGVVPAPPEPAEPPLDPVAAQAMAAGAAPLLYYAVWLPAPAGHMAGPPIYVPAAGAGAGAPFPAPAMPVPPVPPASTPPAPLPSGATSPVAEAAAHNQRLLVSGIIFFVFLVHLPWLVYLVGVHGCWGGFLENCLSAPDETDVFAELAAQPMLFAQVTFLMLRVQSVLAGDWAQFSQAMQISTGVGSFVLTKIVAANGLIAEGRVRVWLLAATCGLAFVVLFWAELHLGSMTRYPELGDETVLAYIDQNLPPDFIAFASVESSLTAYLQFLRLADALILGAALAMPTTQRTRP